MSFRPRLDHGQRHALALVVDAHHPDRHHIAHAHHVVRALHVSIGKLADVDQPRILQADVDERPEVDDVQDRALELHAGGKVFDLQDAFLEDRLGKIVAGVALGAAEAVDDVAQRELAGFELASQLADVDFGQLGAKLGQFFLVANDVRRVAELLEQPGGNAVAFGVNPGAIERLARRPGSSRKPAACV